MTREQYAAHALTGLLSDHSYRHDAKGLADLSDRAFELADLMVKKQAIVKDDTYRLCEAVADISFAIAVKYEQGVCAIPEDSRELMAMVIEAAKKFELENPETGTAGDYYVAIDKAASDLVESFDEKFLPSCLTYKGKE